MSSSHPSARPGERNASSSPANRVSKVLRGSVTTLSTTSNNILNRHVSPQKRQQWKQQVTDFSTRRPYLAGFLFSQLAISVVPVLLMTLFAFTFALLTGVFLGALGAFLFVSFVMGFASLILLPMLFFTSGAAVFIWFWGSVAILAVTLLQRRDRKGRPADRKLEQQQTTSEPLTTISSQSLQSPTSDVPARTPSSTSSSLEPGANQPDPNEDHAEVPTLQVQPEKPQPSRKPAHLLSSPRSDAMASNLQIDKEASGLQSNQADAWTTSPGSPSNGAIFAQAHMNME
ncbi:hypothetical protein H2200_011552 [Cladophialophora chaetospira]|uniref:Uncharacterized protein n=1 Tax=Cladophialophora chaetospira TaxID=386627 RepID=A0AA38WZJ7_9EURO|nr:hypothetical protein H2200_011552 [Cladophialophora chaetospira]